MTEDATRRTHLANERTYLAWWRTGLATLTVALAAARVVPQLADSRHRWPYTVVGAAFAVLGTVCVAYAEQRRRDVERALDEGGYARPDSRIMLGLAVAGVLLGVALLVLIVTEA